jgi:hypothetical protein
VPASNIIYVAALVAAVLAAFVMIPGIDILFVAIGLLLGFLAVPADQRLIFLVAALALNSVAGALAPVPVLGAYLTMILANLSAIANAGAVAVILGLLRDRFAR